MTFFTGRLPGHIPNGLRDVEVYTTGPLPTPPPAVDVPDVPYPLDRNDRIRDCCYAGVDHLIRAWNAEVNASGELPTEDEVESAYLLESPNDRGCVKASVLKRWYTTGIFGNTILGFAPADPRNLLKLHQIIAFYGGAYLGIQCGRPQREQFQRNETWTYTGADEDLGHTVVGLGYRSNGDLLCATWGGIGVLSAGFLAHRLQEAWVVLPPQFAARGDELGLSLATLQADLNRVAL